ALDEWPSNMDLPFWEAKRAAVLAEIGEIKEAERIAEVALNEIRSSLQPYRIDYSLLSKEGWTMLLLHMTKGTKFPRDESDNISQFGNRWEKLRIYRCDPWLEMEILSSVVKGSDFGPRPEREIKKQFDPGMVRVWELHSYEPRYFELQPAFAFLRMFEEGALPVKVGFSTIMGDAVTQAAKWVGSLTPFWSLSFMIRRGDKEEVEEWFNRVRVASMSDEEVLHLHELLMPPFKQAVQHLVENRQGLIKERNLLTRNIGLLSELVSRICFRFPVEQLAETLSLSIEIYNQQASSPYPHIYSYVEHLFERIFYALPESELLKKIPELLLLPIPGEGRPDTERADRVVDPFEFIQWSENASLNNSFDRSSWSFPIARLLRIVNENNPVARRHAISRLVRIHEIGGMNADEKRAFGEALWSKLDSRGFPDHTGFHLYSYLRLPEPKPGQAKEQLRRYLLATDFPQEKHYFKEWLSSDVPAQLPENSNKDRWIDWSPEEATHLLGKLAKWWDENKAKFTADKGSQDYDKAEDSLGDMSLFLLLRLLSWVILPRLNKADDSARETVKRLISELDQAGFCILPALPIMLVVDPNSNNEVAAKLRNGINAIEELYVRYSIFGLYNWLVNGVKGTIPSPPADLINELVNKVTTRRQPGLDVAIGHVSEIIKKLPEVLNESHINLLCIALVYLIAETQLPNEQDHKLITKFTTVVPLDERPDYRKHTAELSYSLFEYLTKKGMEIPEVLTRWQSISQNDPLPEVRRAWKYL
nr:hypothetical protein [Acidobacteriota bacterium]